MLEGDMRGLYTKRPWRPLAAALLLAWALGCAGETAIVALPEPAAPPLIEPASLGERGPYGVLRIPRGVRVRVDARIDVTVLVPLEASGTPAQRRPVAVLVHGGLVSPDRYEWLGVHLATRGFVVLVPGHALDLAFFEQENAVAALRVLRERSRAPGDPLEGTMDEAPAAILGHSLGGVVSASLWDEHPEDFDELVLFASYPAGRSLRPRGRGRALSILGGADARVTRTQAREGLRAIGTSGRPGTLAVIEGMNHMQIADRVSASEAAAAGVATIDEAGARARLRWLVDALLWPRVGGSPEMLDDDAGWPDGVVREAP
jgi:pimeloyl-ACP methyl ester carboxylesterase